MLIVSSCGVALSVNFLAHWTPAGPLLCHAGVVYTLHHHQVLEVGKPEADIRAVEVAAFDIALHKWEGGKYGEAGPSWL